MRTLLVRGGGAGRPYHRIRAADGMVTAEFAIGLLAVLPVLLGIVMLVAAATVKVQVVEGARTAARELARGDSEGQAVERVRAFLPRAQVHVIRGREDVAVVVTDTVDPAGILPGFTVTGRAVTRSESTDE